jgi:hypothetical protein
MSRCQACQGIGFEYVHWPERPAPQPWLGAWFPCHKCRGSGLENCSEGLREQPEQARTAASEPPAPENNDKR